MFKLPFGRRTEGADAAEPRDAEEIWELPDMESVSQSESISPQSASAFGYDDTQIHPEGVFTAELIGWRPLDGQRAVWRFRSIAENGTEPLPRDPLPFVTGTVCRPDNHLGRLAAALRIVPGIETPADLQKPEIRTAIRDAIASLEPDTLQGRQCRIEVEHVRDDVGDATARIKSVAPMGWI